MVPRNRRFLPFRLTMLTCLTIERGHWGCGAYMNDSMCRRFAAVCSTGVDTVDRGFHGWQPTSLAVLQGVSSRAWRHCVAPFPCIAWRPSPLAAAMVPRRWSRGNWSWSQVSLSLSLSLSLSPGHVCYRPTVIEAVAGSGSQW